MRYFDSFAHLSWRSSSDHRELSRSGVKAVVEPCTWPGRPRTDVSTFQDHFSSLVGFEPTRASRFGVSYYSALALNPREANLPHLALPVTNLLGHFLSYESVVAVGETGYDSITTAEDHALEWHLEWAARFGLPVLLRVPAVDRAKAVRRALDVLRTSGLPSGAAAVGPNDEETAGLVLDAGHWASHALCLRARSDAERVAAVCRRFGVERILAGSGADWDLSDASAIPKLADALDAQDFGPEAVETLLWKNPVAFFGRSGRLPASLGTARRRVFPSAVPRA
ncbi:MAG: TatD family hydrolase [Elusimicrobia bacterium]|nr:TatD family hydrolase [Elusimicrobiota bacterium]